MPKGKAKKISKMEAMRQAIQKLGVDAANDAIQAALKSDFGVTMTTGMFSTYKSAILREMGKGKKGRKLAPKATEAPVANGRKVGAGGGITVDEIAAVKKLIDTIGAEKVQQLARVLAE